MTKTTTSADGSSATEAPRPKSTAWRLADGRTLRVPLPPMPEGIDPDGSLWTPRIPVDLYPENYRPLGRRGKERPRAAARSANVNNVKSTTSAGAAVTGHWWSAKQKSATPPTPSSPEAGTDARGETNGKSDRAASTHNGAELSPKQLLNIRDNTPLRPPNWRWRLARHFIARDEIPQPDDGDEVLRLWHYLLVSPNCCSYADLSRLRHWLPEVHQAVQLHGQRGLCLEVEARLLAREPLSEIAGKTMFSAGAIRMFASLFFHVADRLDAPGWITHQVIRLHEKPPEEPTELLGRYWKYFGYWAGPAVVDDLVYELCHLRRPETPEEVSAFWDRAIRTTLERRSALAVRLIPIDGPKAAFRLIRAATRLKERDRRGRERSGPQVSVVAHMEAAINCIDESLGGSWWRSKSNGQGTADETPASGGS